MYMNGINWKSSVIFATVPCVGKHNVKSRNDWQIRLKNDL